MLDQIDPKPDGKPWTPVEAKAEIKSVLSNASTGNTPGANAVHTAISNIIKNDFRGHTVNSLKGIEAVTHQIDYNDPMRAAINKYADTRGVVELSSLDPNSKLAREMKAAGLTTLSTHDNGMLEDFSFKYRGKNVTVGQGHFGSLSADERNAFSQQLLSGNVSSQMIVRGQDGRYHALGGKVANDVNLLGAGSNILNGINSGQITQIELGPQSAAFFRLIKNPAALTQSQFNYLASTGQGSTTTNANDIPR